LTPHQHADAAAVERRGDVDLWQTRQVIRELINARYAPPIAQEH
jgi:hypothetical protein